MARISIDGGKTYTTVEDAMSHVVFEMILKEMHGPAFDEAEKLTRGGSVFDLLRKYLELSKDDIII